LFHDELLCVQQTCEIDEDGGHDDALTTNTATEGFIPPR
jgi:hypothetical protein